MHILFPPGRLYFVIAFREKALEIWSLESMVLLKRMNSKLKGLTFLVRISEYFFRGYMEMLMY